MPDVWLDDHEANLAQQAAKLAIDTETALIYDQLAPLACDALEVTYDPVVEYAGKFKATSAQMIQFRWYMTRHGIEYAELDALE